MKVIIIGGVAGGASCAARLRRLDENAEIVMVERGPYVSYANCGLPYHVGGVIPEGIELLVATADTFKALFKVDARTMCEAIAIAGKKNRRPQGPGDRRGHHRILRQAGPVAGRAVDPAAAARNRPAGHLRGQNGAGRPGNPSVAGQRYAIFVRDEPLFRHPGRPAENPRGGCGRRIYRAGDGGKPGPSRLRRDSCWKWVTRF